MTEKILPDLADIKGLGDKTLEKLHAYGIHTVEALATCNAMELEKVDVDSKTASKIILEARKLLEIPFISAFEYQKWREENIWRLKTNIEALDQLLGGGLESRTFTELYGEFGTCKTVLCHRMAVEAVRQTEGSVLYLDNEEGFRASWIVRIADFLDLKPEAVLKRIIIAQSMNVDHQILIMEKSDEKIKKENVKLLIVDGLMSHFRAEFLGREMLASRQQRLNYHLTRMARYASVFNFPILITNQVSARPDAFTPFPVATGGYVLSHACLPADTLVQLGDGTISRIEQIHNPDSLVCVDFDVGKTEKGYCEGTYLTDEKNLVYEIRGKTLIRATPEHKFFKLDTQTLNVVEVEAEELTVGDYIAYPKRIHVEGSSNGLPKFPKFHEPKFYRIKPKGAKLLKQKLAEKRIPRKHPISGLKLHPRLLRASLNQELAISEKNLKGLLNICDFSKSFVRLYCDRSFSHKHRGAMLPKNMSPKLAQFYGYFLGDGSLTAYSIRFKDENLSLLQTYKTIGSRLFGIEGKIYKVPSKRCYELSFNSIYVRQLFDCSREEVYKAVSRTNNEIVSSFIRGLMDAEGYVGDNRITIGNTDKELLTVLQLLLLRLGISSIISKARIKPNHSKAYSLNIDSSESQERFLKIVGTSSQPKLERLKRLVANKVRNWEVLPISRDLLKGYLPNKKYKHITRQTLHRLKQLPTHLRERIDAVFNGDVGWQKIISKVPITINSKLYDLETSHRNFIANGTIVHNSHTRLWLRTKYGSPIRIARLVVSPDLPEGECLFKITENGIEEATEK